MKLIRIISLLCLIIAFSYLSAQPTERDIDLVLAKVNLLRSTGCKCGNTDMPPVGAVNWNDKLYQASRAYAQYMHKHNHFEHVSLEGEDLGDRLDKVRYPWLKIGENLAYGYDHFDDAMQAWIESPSHCRMLMDPDVTEVGMSKKGIYWAQSWGKPEPDFASQ